MKKVSIIMATYKTPHNILEVAIESILNQTYENIELIIICDGDREEYEYIKTYENNNVKIIYNKKNMGLPYSLNRGIEESTGDYIARMDSDDISVKNRIEKQVEFLEKNKNISLCSTYAKLFGDETGTKIVPFTHCDDIKIELLFRSTLIHPTIMGRREVFEKYKYDEMFKCSQDFELWSRISDEYKIEVIPIIGLKYRMHSKQISNNRKKEQEDNSKRIIRMNSKKITGEYDERIYNTLYYLSGREKINSENYKQISRNIDYIIIKNQIFNNKNLKKVLYNRFFELIIKNRILCIDMCSIRKILHIYNIVDIIKHIKYSRGKNYE